MSFETLDTQKSMFTVEMDYEEIIEIPEDYNIISLGDLDHGETFTGKPQMTGIQTVEFEELDAGGLPLLDDDGNPITKTVHKMRLVITNSDDEESLSINVNLKSKDIVVKQIRKGSVLFDFVQSILELENPGCTEGKNLFRNVNLQQFIDFINQLSVLGIKNIERNGKFKFNSFYVIQVNSKTLN